MATKSKVIEELKDKSYSFAEVKHLMGTITIIDGNPPSKYKKGDVYASYQGVKRRPICIIKVVDDLVFGIPLSSTKDTFYLHEHKSRFFKNGYFTNQLVSSSIDYVDENFLGILDDNRNLNIAVKKLQNLILNLWTQQ